MSDALMRREEAQIVDTRAVEQIARADVDMQVATAKQWPRSLQAFRQEALALATKNQKVAATCYFSLPRGNKRVEGPSVRLAEIIAGTWGNLRCETRLCAVGETTVTAQATCWDMQRNVLIRSEVSRRITDRNGKRYNEDMIIMTGNAAASIAFRNAIFRVVPMAYVNDIYEEAKRVAVTGQGTIDEARAKWLAHFDKVGVSKARVLAMLGRKGIEDIDIDDLSALQGLHTALSEGHTNLDDAFPEPELKKGKPESFGFTKKGKEQVKAKKEDKKGAEQPLPEPTIIDDNDTWGHHEPPPRQSQRQPGEDG